MKRNLCLTVMLAWSVALLWATDYATPRQQALAAFLELKGVDTLSVGEHTNYSYKGRPLSIRVNEWKEVEHIGFKLFNRAIAQKNETVLYDFIERYLLEKIAAENTEHAVRLALDNVKFNVGTPNEIFLFTGNETFHYSCESFTSYSIEWKRGNRTVLSISFEMDYQLLTGCDAVQLEELFLKKMLRYKVKENDTVNYEIDFPEEDYFVKEGNYFLIDAIRNDLYFQRNEGKWELIADEKDAYKSLSNTMLCSKTEGNYRLNLKLDKYGYKESSCSVDLRALQQLCEEEGCTAYFGIKEKREDKYTGTLFWTNELLGYTHMLSVEMPIEALKKKEGILKGRLFVYIPMQNVTKKFFNQNNYKKIQ